MKKRIAIIGGGITGLVCAYELTRADYDVVIFEGSSQVGGLAAGFVVNNTHLEKAYHHIFTTDTDIIALANDLGVGDSLKWYTSSVGTYYNNKLYPFTGVSDVLRFSPLTIFQRLRLGAVLFYLGKVSSWQKFVAVPASVWLERWFGARIYSVIWRPLLSGKFHDYYPRVSMAWLWARVHTRANSRKSIFDREKLGYFTGGFQVLVDALVKEITDKNGKILTETRVTSINSKNQAVACVNFDGKSSEFDAVVATVPSHIFASLVESQVEMSYLQKLRSVEYLGALCAVFTSPQDLSKFYWNNIADPGYPFLVLVQHTRLLPKSMYSNEHVYYLGSYLPHDHKYFLLDEERLYGEYFAALSSLFPHFDASKITQRFLFRLKNAQHVVDTTYPEKIADYSTPLTNIYLANFAQIFPEDRGTNYSVREGIKVAKLVKKEL